MVLKITGRRVWLAVGASMGLVMLLGLLAVSTTRRVAELGAYIDALHSAVGGAEALRAEVEHAESAHRAFLLTADRRFLSASRQAEAQAGRHRDSLVELLSASGEQQGLINQLDQLLETRFALMHRVIEIFEQRGGEAAVEAVRSGAGAAAMDTLRTHLRAMTDRHATLLVQQLARQERSVTITRVALALSVVLTLLLLGIAGLIIVRDLRLQEENLARRAAAEESLNEAILAAGRANRAKADFLARVSHEMRTPLNAILGMAELLRDSPLNPEQNQYARTIETSGEDLLNVVSDLLDSSKIEAGQMELEAIPFSPREVIESVAEVAAVRAEAKDLEVVLALSPQLPAQLRGDPTRLRQLLMNLLGNAVKFTEHGQVTVRADVTAAERDRVELRIDVEDTGVGIAKENLDRIFLPFVQADSSTSRRFGGTGLGLNIAQSLAHSMSGSIGVESELGRGSTFRLIVRMTAEDPRPVLGGAELQGYGVLLLIENRVRRDAIERLLAAAGATPVVARTLAEAQVEIGQRPLHAAVIEASAPGVDGLLRGAPTPLHGLPIVLLTRLAESVSSTRRHWPAGLEQVLTPIRQKRFVETLQSVLRTPAVPATTAHAPTVDRPAWPRVPSRILMADDSAENRALVLSFLKGQGYRIDVAEAGDEAIECAERFRYDLILMDVDMPGVDGLDATRAIRSLEQSEGRLPTPTVALTAHAVDGYRDRCLAAGMDDFATKPISGDALRQLVERWVDRQPVILVVDDAPESQLVVRSFLRSEPYRLVFASNGASALRALGAQRISAVLLDMNLPDMEGYAVAAEIRALPGHSELPVIAVTGHTGAEARARCLAAGCSAYLSKPLRRPDLLRVLADALTVAVPQATSAESGADRGEQSPTLVSLAHLRECAGQTRRALARGDRDGARTRASELRTALEEGPYPRLHRSATELVRALGEQDVRGAEFWVERVMAELGETERLEALRATGLLDSPRDEYFDAITRRVAARLGVPVALVSLVARDRQFFKSSIGLPEPWAELRQTPLTHSFCQHVVSARRPLVIADAREHPVVRDNLAIPDLGVIAYAGVPLVTSDGHALGSLCAIDTRPRTWSDEDLLLLRNLATDVERAIEREVFLRRAASDDAALAESGEEDELLTSFATRFLETRREELQQARVWVEEGRLEAIARFGHQLKGTAATFGFPDVGMVAARLEAAAKGGDVETTRAELDALRPLLDQRR
jgi:signal transduction histidine kinase/CheY-like chemotaxis protein/HPt (histidine-containing phosphotransfer) domain-containing protein